MSLIKRNFPQIRKSLSFIIFLYCSIASFAQSTYIPLGDKENDILSGLEIKTGDQQLFFSVVKPYSRSMAASEAEMIDSMFHAHSGYGNLSKVDIYNLHNLLMENSEYTKQRSYYLSKHPLGSIYKTKDNFAEVNNKNFFLAINPVLGFSAGKENGDNNTLYQTAYGLTLRGKVSDVLGFNFYITNNQDRYPLYISQWVTTHNAVPGQGTYTATFDNAGNLDHVNYVDPRGSVSLKVTKHINLQLGYDHNFIGDGYRSMFLSDFSGSTAFVKIDTRIWKFNYENLYMQLYTPHTAIDTQLQGIHRYMRANEISINATKWLNAGVFESVVFSRKSFYDISYIPPVMFLRPAESNIGSGDNANVGFHAKANVSGSFQFYGQIMLDEFVLSNFASSNGWWANKQAYQLGIKYVDAFGLKNLDLQLEYNEVRPYTFSHFDSTNNYTNNDQPLAHPLGANFKEFIFIVKAQPLPRLYITATAIHYFQGLDSAGVDFGSNPFENYNDRPRQYGFYIGDGDKAKATILSANISYELKENLFIDLTAWYRTYSVPVVAGQSVYPLQGNTSVVNIGFRWNFARKDFNFY